MPLKNASTVAHERAKLWRARDLGGIELLSAAYTTHAFARHTHDEFMVGMIEWGACAFYYRGATHIAPAGSIVVIHPGEVHDGSGGEAGGLAYRALYPAVALLQQAATELTGKQHALPYFPEPLIQDASLGRSLLAVHLALEQPASPLERESRFLWTFAQLIACYAEHRPEALAVGKEHRAVRQVREYLEAHAVEQVTLAQLASIANLSPYHLLRVFRAELGLPPHAYLTQLRVLRAKKLLALGLPIPQAALEAGFVDQSHLTRHFKRLVGVTPGQFAPGSKNVQDRAVWSL